MRDQLVIARENRIRVIKDYNDAIRRALEKDIPYTEIAKVMGVTEAAIRLYAKRHGIDSSRT